jgi:hypothetical protein
MTASSFASHKDFPIMNWIVIAVKIPAPRQACLAIRIADNMLDLDTTTATSLIFSSLRR